MYPDKTPQKSRDHVHFVLNIYLVAYFAILVLVSYAEHLLYVTFTHLENKQ